MRSIDADALPIHKAYCVDEAGFGATFYVVDKSDIDNAPTIDAVPVVRCESCCFCKEHPTSDKVKICTNEKWNTEYYPLVDDDGFCSYGERRSDD